MSRTIRRTKVRNQFDRFEKDYTHYIPEEWDGRDIGNRGVRWVKDFPLVPLEGKEFQKAYWKFHSDNGFAEFGFENAFERYWLPNHGERRVRYKRELQNWIENPDYEIQFTRIKQIWDLC